MKYLKLSLFFFIIFFFHNAFANSSWITKKNTDLNCNISQSIKELNKNSDNFYNNENYNEAFNCALLASDKGDSYATANLGWHYQTGNGITKNYKKANELFEKGIKKNNIYSYTRLALSYSNGWGVKKNIKKAFELNLKAAKKDDDYAQAEIGWHYLNGEGTLKNEKLSYSWFLKSANQENTYAQAMLGWMIANGTGTEQDYKKGFEISLKAAKKGDDYAQANIGWHYANGFGVKKNIEEALIWYEKAKEQNNEFAIKEINRLDKTQEEESNNFITKNDSNLSNEENELNSWITKKSDEIETIIKDRNDEAVAKKAEKQINKNIQIKFFPIDEERMIIKTTRLRESYDVDSLNIKTLYAGEKVWVSKKLDDDNIIGEWFFIETEDNKKGYVLGDKLGLGGLEAKAKDTPVTPNKIPIFDIEWGNYYALVIGNNNYSIDLHPLKTAVNDANEMSKLLEEKYGFEVKTLLNATRIELFEELKKYRKKLKENDNLLIYYAGHGTVDIDNNEGYWQLIGSKEEESWTWFSVSALVNQIKAYNTKHVIVIADSCFSGSIFQATSRGSNSENKSTTLDLEDFFKKKNNAKVRLAITSGNYEYVPDAIDGSDHSPFATTLLSLLHENDDYLLADELFSNLEKNINLYPTNQTPRFGSLIMSPGHHDPTGDFIFVPKILRKG